MKNSILEMRRVVGVSLTTACLLAAFCGGCSTTAGIEATGKKSWDLDGAPGLSKNVVINNGSLAGDIEIADLKSAKAGDLMRAQVSLRSKTRDTISIQYQFNWYDAQGLEIAANTGAWKPFLIYGRETRTIQGVAPDPRAHEFKLKIRETDND